jgi:hypothetical protein
MATSSEQDFTVDGVQRHLDLIYFTHTSLPDTFNVMGERGLYQESSAMPTCAENFVVAYTEVPGFTPVADPVSGGGDGHAWMQYDYDDQGTGTRTTLYVECRWLGQDVTLTVHHTAPAAEFAQGTALREQLLAGLDTTGIGMATPVASPDPVTTVEAGEEIGSYVSPRFGYTLTYDDAVWTISTGQGSGTMSGYEVLQDTLQLTNQTGTVTIRAIGESGWFGTSNSMPTCAEDALRAFTVWDDLEPLASPVPGGGDGQAWVQADYEIEGVPTTVYIECRWLGGDVTLKIEQTAPTAAFAQWVEAREALLAGLDTTGLTGSDATPVGVGTPEASPVASLLTAGSS